MAGDRWRTSRHRTRKTRLVSGTKSGRQVRWGEASFAALDDLGSIVSRESKLISSSIPAKQYSGRGVATGECSRFRRRRHKQIDRQDAMTQGTELVLCDRTVYIIRHGYNVTKLESTERLYTSLVQTRPHK